MRMSTARRCSTGKMPTAHVGRGLVLRTQNQFDKSLAEYDRALAINPELATAHAGRGITLNLKMLWGGSGENISIAALSKPMEPRYDETQSQDCERPQPVSRPAGYGRDGDRGDRDESIELACGWHCSWCRAPAAEETGDRRARIAQAVEPLACGGRKERPPDHTHRRRVRGRTRRLLAGALARCAGHREPRHSCVERRGDARTPPGEERSARHRASEARLSRLAARRARALQDGRGADACRGGRQAAEPGSRDAGWRGEPDYHSGQGGVRPARHSQLQPEAEGGRRAPRALTHARG